MNGHGIEIGDTKHGFTVTRFYREAGQTWLSLEGWDGGVAELTVDQWKRFSASRAANIVAASFDETLVDQENDMTTHDGSTYLEMMGDSETTNQRTILSSGRTVSTIECTHDFFVVHQRQAGVLSAHGRFAVSGPFQLDDARFSTSESMQHAAALAWAESILFAPF